MLQYFVMGTDLMFRFWLFSPLPKDSLWRALMLPRPAAPLNTPCVNRKLVLALIVSFHISQLLRLVRGQQSGTSVHLSVFWNMFYYHIHFYRVRIVSIYSFVYQYSLYVTRIKDLCRVHLETNQLHNIDELIPTRFEMLTKTVFLQQKINLIL